MADKPTDTRSPQEIIDGMKQAEQTQAMDAYNVGFTMESPEAIREQKTTEWEAGKARKSKDQTRWEAGQKQTLSDDFWKAVDAADPAMLALGAAGGQAVKAATPIVKEVMDKGFDIKSEATEHAGRYSKAAKSLAAAEQHTDAVDAYNKRRGVHGPLLATKWPEKELSLDITRKLFKIRALSDFGPHDAAQTAEVAQLRTEIKDLAASSEDPGLSRAADDMLKEFDRANEAYREITHTRPGTPVFATEIEGQKMHTTKGRGPWGKSSAFHRAQMEEVLAKANLDALATPNYLQAAEETSAKAGRAAKAARAAKGLGTAAVTAATAPALAGLAPAILGLQAMAEYGQPDKTIAYMAFRGLRRPVEHRDLGPDLIEYLNDNPHELSKLHSVGAVSTDLVEEITGSVPAKPAKAATPRRTTPGTGTSPKVY